MDGVLSVRTDVPRGLRGASGAFNAAGRGDRSRQQSGDVRMRLSSKQAYYLLAVLKDSLCIAGMPLGGYDSEQRRALYNEILNQQDGTIVDLDTEPRK